MHFLNVFRFLNIKKLKLIIQFQIFVYVLFDSVFKFLKKKKIRFEFKFEPDFRCLV